LQKRPLWWEPASFKPGSGSEGEEPPIFFSISIAQISGRELVAS
jgi:nitroimidazol reductase NimA-like FMN-containing flavoprotein (pyridoxamine 5'-phosphate oxidase superfamily)